LFDNLADNGVSVTDDLVGLFREGHSRPAQRLRFGQLSFRARRGMVPDGRISIPVGDDLVREMFIEFKIQVHFDIYAAHVLHYSQCACACVYPKLIDTLLL
jgi:hypothetical protein